LEALASIVFATIFQLPFHLVIASPFLVAAWLVARLTRRWRGSFSRTLLLTGIAAVGVAPLYGFHLSMMPAYAIYLSGAAKLGETMVAMLATWIAFLFALAAYRWAMRVRAQYHAPPPAGP